MMVGVFVGGFDPVFERCYPSRIEGQQGVTDLWGLQEGYTRFEHTVKPLNSTDLKRSHDQVD